jgi:hypothetical protein
MVRVWMATAAAAALVLAAPCAGAQTAAPLGAGAPTMQAASLSPRLALQPAVAPDVPEAPLPAASSGGLDNGEKLMILGGAALIAGAIIGNTAGTIIMIGGAGVGLYGLYLHLGRPKGMADEIGFSRSF